MQFFCFSSFKRALPLPIKAAYKWLFSDHLCMCEHKYTPTPFTWEVKTIGKKKLHGYLGWLCTHPFCMQRIWGWEQWKIAFPCSVVLFIWWVVPYRIQDPYIRREQSSPVPNTFWVGLVSEYYGFSLGKKKGEGRVWNHSKLKLTSLPYMRGKSKSSLLFRKSMIKCDIWRLPY